MPPKVRKPRGKAASTTARRAASEGKVRKEFWLDPKVLADAQAFLGTASERETVEAALDLVGFRKELATGSRALRGMRLRRLD